MAIPEKLKQKVEKLEKIAEEIELSAISLINNTPLKYDSMSTENFVALGVSDYSWGPIPPYLRTQQTEIIGKYRGWYNSTLKIVEMYLPDDKLDFIKYYKKKDKKDGINGVIDFLHFNVDVWKKNKSGVIKSFKNAFSYQRNLLNSIKYIEIEEIESESPSFHGVEEKYIKLSFADYGLHYYDSFVDLINNAVVFNDFYKVTPFLLRCLFENLLYDIFQSSLQNQHKDLYFIKPQNRARDFSQLIILLDLLKKNEYKHIIKDSINPKTIEILENIKKIGNYTVHDVIEKVSRSDVEEWKDNVHLALKPLLVCYQKLEKEKISIKRERQIKIKQKLGLFHKDDDDTSESEVEVEEFEIKVDFSLIELYIDILEKGEIDPDTVISTLDTIQNELGKLGYMRKISPDNLLILEKLCLLLKRFIKDKDGITKRRILYILYHLINNKLTEDLLKNNFFEIIQNLFKSGEVYNDVIRILDHFDFFQNILKFLSDAIDKNNLPLLKAYHSSIKYSKFKENRLEILKGLKKITSKIKSSSTDLKKILQKIIHKFENIK